MKKIYQVSFINKPDLYPLFFENHDEAVEFVLMINLFLTFKHLTPQNFAITTQSLIHGPCSFETLEAIFSDCFKNNPSNN